MFEIPDAKRVRRDELFGSGASDRGSSPDTADEAEAEAKAQLLNAKLSSLLSLKFEFDDGSAKDDEATAAKESTKAPVKQPELTKKEEKETKQTSQDDDESSSSGDESDSDEDTPMKDQPPQEQEEDGAAEFEFRLFSTSAPQKIVLPCKDEEEGAGETVIADRPLSYYIRGELAPEQQEQFRAAAVTSQDILNWAKQRAWGLEVPWRVKRIVVTVKGKKAEGVAAATTQHGQVQPEDGEQQKKKKKRLGKKGRIAMRIKEKVRKEKEEAEQKQKMTKEEHLKEKKKRLNREKKLKRRQKEKEKKMAGKAGSSVGDAMSAVGQDSDSE
ncbi:hypothetical protein QBC45DRAFT_419305 [Copromyces sp. CBS 386.78]|nr:hypothetical protein QBC45DRAFT_419305 [Copromyces sp. CBS 386.78]